MKVWILSAQEYEDWWIVGVYTSLRTAETMKASRENARDYYKSGRKRGPSHRGWEDYEINEWEVDADLADE